MFQDGIIAQAVDEVVASGVSYFSAAGNEGRQGYESQFRTGTVFDPDLNVRKSALRSVDVNRILPSMARPRELVAVNYHEL